MKHILRSFAGCLLIMMLIAASCGGDVISPVDDVTPPSVLSTTPVDNETDVATNSTITVTFGEPMSRAATEAAFGSSPVIDCIFSWASNDSQLACDPNSDLQQDTTYQVTIDTGASDRSSNNLPNAYTFAFDTPPADDVTLPDVLRGVNLAGAEFGVTPERGLPGEYARAYIYPHEAPGYDSVLAYYADKGVRVIRLPFRWERMQRELFSPLDTAELNRLDGFVEAAERHGMQVILDPHNYARYCDRVEMGFAPYCGSDRLIGKSAVTNEAFADFWRKLANHFNGDPVIYAYALVNEPTYLDTSDRSLWPIAAQAAVDAIREVDPETLIMVPGNGWSAAWTWNEYNADLWIDDPANNLMYEAHQYFDRNNEGKYDEDYDASGAYPDIGVDRIEPFVNWLDERDARGFVGEFGVPADDSRWLTVLDRFLDHLDEHCIGAAYWAGGPWWGSYNLSIEPVGGSDKPQMTTLQQHPSFECSE